MKKNTKKDGFLKLVIKHLLILIVVSLLASLGLYVASLNPATTLHSNAYRDIIRSIVFVYILFFSVSVAGAALVSRVIAEREIQWNATNTKDYFSKITPYETIGITFTLVTVINSIMMLTGFDQPKQGVFAYVHLMTRLGIISVIVIFIYFKEIIEGIKTIKLKNLSLTDLLYAPKKNALIGVAKAFTTLSLVYCSLMIAFQGILPASGGRSFYLSLLIMLGLISLARVISIMVKGK